MEGVYLTPISRLLEIILAVSGIVIVYLMARLFLSRHAWGDGAQYEMLDLATPERDDFDMVDETGVGQEESAVVTAESEFVEKDHAALEGLVGLEDRIVRFGFTLALSYLSITWFGIRSLAMWLLVLPVLYLAGTALAGKDPIYRWLGLSTQFD